MRLSYIIDYSSCILVRLLGPTIRALPVNSALFLGRRLGDFLYCFDLKHKSQAYANIKTALGNKFSPRQLNKITKNFYRNFGQSLIEMFLIPSISKEYLNKYITVKDKVNISEGFKAGRGVILLGVHSGSWELSNVICANLGFPFNLLVGSQRYPRLNKLLNSYRRLKGCKIIERRNGSRELIQALKNNEAIGLTADQGGRTGILVKFFGKEASMPVGAIKLALKYDATLLPCYYTRIKGPYIRTMVGEPLQLKKTPGNREKDICDNLQDVVRIFEGYIETYPEDYLWTYKIWKYGRERNILILSDAKTGHLRQSQSVAKILCNYLADKGIKVRVDTAEVKFRNNFSRLALTFSNCLAGKYHCQGCLWCLRKFLEYDVYKSLVNLTPDMIISCGASMAPVNFVLSRESLAKSIVVMRPSIFSTKRFDLVIMPRHDNPPARKNVVVTLGALNLIDDEYLREQSEELQRYSGLEVKDFKRCIGLMIGGDTRHFSLAKDAVAEVIKQIKSISEIYETDILVTTSRRTPLEVEGLLKQEFKDYARCKALVIANEKNLPFAVGGILGWSQIVVVSCESISMISEAASAGCYTVVFKSEVNSRHNRFLSYMAEKEYIYLCQPAELSSVIDFLKKNRPKIKKLNNNFLIENALGRIL
jgi:lauroyl/myristoyl acyltransferase/mitochondrial fission protein ELM1